MSKAMNKMGIIGMTNITTMAISKGVTFVGVILVMTGAGGMMLSNKYFTEEEMKYIRNHVPNIK